MLDGIEDVFLYWIRACIGYAFGGNLVWFIGMFGTYEDRCFKTYGMGFHKQPLYKKGIKRGKQTVERERDENS